MPHFDKLHKYASEFAKLAQMPQPDPLGKKKKDNDKGATVMQADYPVVLFESGLSPWSAAPSIDNPKPSLNYQSVAFTKYINPALDAAGTEGKVNITFSIDPNRNVIVRVTGDSTAGKVQAMLQKTWGAAMTAAMNKASVTAPTYVLDIGSVINYG